MAVEIVDGASVGSEHADEDAGVKVGAANVTDSVVQPAPVLVVFDVDAVDIETKVADAQHATEYGCNDSYSDRNDGIGFRVHPPVQSLVDGDAAVVAAAVGDVAFEVTYCCQQHSAFYAAAAVAVVVGVEMEIAVGFGDCTVVQVDFQY